MINYMKKCNFIYLGIISLIVAGCGNDVENEQNCKNSISSLNNSVENLSAKAENLSERIKQTKWVSDKEAQLSDLDFIVKGANLHSEDVEKMLPLKQYSNCVKFSQQLVKLNNGVGELLVRTADTIDSVDKQKDAIILGSKCKLEKKCDLELNNEVRNELFKNTSKIQEDISKIVAELQKMTIDLSKMKSNFKSKLQ